jgi:hypothetical protein
VRTDVSEASSLTLGVGGETPPRFRLRDEAMDGSGDTIDDDAVGERGETLLDSALEGEVVCMNFWRDRDRREAVRAFGEVGARAVIMRDVSFESLDVLILKMVVLSYGVIWGREVGRSKSRMEMSFPTFHLQHQNR